MSDFSHLKGKSLVDILHATGLLSKEASEELTSVSRAAGLKPAEAATRLGFLSENAVTRALGYQSGFPIVLDPDTLDGLIHREALYERREIYARKRALPLTDGRIGIGDPAEIPELARELGIQSLSTSRWCILPGTYLEFRLSDLLGTRTIDVPKILETPFRNSEASPTRLRDLLLDTAWKAKASDIHIEPMARFVRIRGRVEGTLRFWVAVPREAFEPVGNLIRTMAGLTNRSMTKSHDGEFTFMADRTEVPVRVSLMPTIHRQFSMVLRLLGSGPSSEIVPEVLGFSESALKKILLIAELAGGMALITGPTGSGKNTTLHAAFRRILESRPGNSFVEVADPVEYRLYQGVQSQVWRSETDQWTYADALRSSLRHDPDAILVGEIRDAETASIAVEAALTGHLLLSTLHTTEASAVFDRMGRLGIPSPELLSVLRIVVNQRLVGRLCPACRTETDVATLPKELFKLAEKRNITRIWSAGSSSCSSCQGSGTLGRYAAAEILVLDQSARSGISKANTWSSVKLQEFCKETDPTFETLPEILLTDAASGKTSRSELLRLVGSVI